MDGISLPPAEIISLGSKTYTLQGLGSLLGNSVSSGQYIQALVGTGYIGFNYYVDGFLLLAAPGIICHPLQI